MITVHIPPGFDAERDYILFTVLDQFLGLEFRTEKTETREWRITNEDDRELAIRDTFFDMLETEWLQASSQPSQQPLRVWDVSGQTFATAILHPQIPVIYGDDPSRPGFFDVSESRIFLGLDIFGSAFFMLTRYEEAVKSERDTLGRFPATASLAFKEGFLSRPVVNEYVEILWACMKQLWPQLNRRPGEFRMLVSHDVDEPFKYPSLPTTLFIRGMAGDILKRCNPAKAFIDLGRWIRVRSLNIMTADPYYTFDTIMDISDKHGVTSAFYFLADNSAGIRDGLYTIENQHIRDLIGHIHARGHEIGLHASYNSYNDSASVARETERLKAVCKKEGVQQTTWGVRQHFLRWETPTTFRNLSDAGLDYDTTLCFADSVGFRCGTCYEYTAYDLLKRQKLSIIERPLIALECSVIDERYMGLGTGDEAFNVLSKLKSACRHFNGNFTLLWHNNRLVIHDEHALYERILSY